MRAPARLVLLSLVGASVALLLLLTLPSCGENGEEERPRPRYDSAGRWLEPSRPDVRLNNLVVVILDTLRGDAIRLPGGAGQASSPARMPFLESLGARGVVMADATAPAPWTLPTVTSMLTGLLPTEHGVNDPRYPPILPEAVTTFAEVLWRGWGYETAAYTVGAWFKPQQGILQGFDTVNLEFALQGTEALVGRWAQRRDPERPFFLLLHTFEVHDPYGAHNHPWPRDPMQVPEPSGIDIGEVRDPWDMVRWFLLDERVRGELSAARGKAYLDTVIRQMTYGHDEDPRPELMQELADAYWEGARWVDGLLESTVAWLEDQRLLDDTLLVVLADHGEAFAEHGIVGHGRSLHDVLVRVPLVMSGPGPFSGGRVVSGGVSLLDVLPTFMDWCGIPPPDGVRGRSFLPLLEGREGGRPIISQEHLHNGNTRTEVDADTMSVRTTRWKYMLERDRISGEVRERLYDLAADPDERRDLAAASGRLPREVALEADLCAAIEEGRDLLFAGGPTSVGARPADLVPRTP